MEVGFGDTGADPPPGCFQVSDEFVGCRQGEDAGFVSVGEFVGAGLDESGGDGGVSLQGDYYIFEGAGVFQCLFVQGVCGVSGHRGISSVDGVVV